MSGVNLQTGFPPIDSTVRWRLPVNGRTVEFRAAVETWRPSGELRVYRMRSPGGELVTAVMDLNPDSGRLRMTACDDANGPFQADVVFDHA